MSAFNHPRLLKRERERHAPPPIQCSECGYDLRGIPLDAPCPECGRSRKKKSPAGVHQNAGLVGAPPGEQARFAIGFALLALGATPSIAIPVLARYRPDLAPIAGLACASAWCLGLAIILLRPFGVKVQGSARDRLDPLALVGFFTQFAWLGAALVGFLVAGGKTPAWVGVALVGVGLLGLIPTTIGLGKVVDWAGDEQGAHRMGWLGFAFVGSALLVVADLYLFPYLYGFLIVMVPAIILIALVVPMLLCWGVLSLTCWQAVSLVQWARAYRIEAEERARRLRERFEQQRALAAAPHPAGPFPPTSARADGDAAERPVGLDDLIHEPTRPETSDGRYNRPVDPNDFPTA